MTKMLTQKLSHTIFCMNLQPPSAIYYVLPGSY